MRIYPKLMAIKWDGKPALNVCLWPRLCENSDLSIVRKDPTAQNGPQSTIGASGDILQLPKTRAVGVFTQPRPVPAIRSALKVSSPRCYVDLSQGLFADVQEFFFFLFSKSPANNCPLYSYESSDSIVTRSLRGAVGCAYAVRRQAPFLGRLPSTRPGRSLLDGQHSIAIPLRGEPRVLQSFRYFVGNIPAAG